MGGGLDLVAARALADQVAIGSPLRVGLLWRASTHGPSARQLRLRLVRASGEVVQDSALPLLGGRVAPSTLRASNVVRDEESLVVDARSAQAETVAVEVALDDSVPVRLGTVVSTGQGACVGWAFSGQPALATFGGSMDFAYCRARAGIGRFGLRARRSDVKLRWRSAAAMSAGYKVFVHVLDPSGQQVVAQRDAEPQDGERADSPAGCPAGGDTTDAYEVPAARGPRLPASTQSKWVSTTRATASGSRWRVARTTSC